MPKINSMDSHHLSNLINHSVNYKKPVTLSNLISEHLCLKKTSLCFNIIISFTIKFRGKKMGADMKLSIDAQLLHTKKLLLKNTVKSKKSFEPNF